MHFFKATNYNKLVDEAKFRLRNTRFSLYVQMHASDYGLYEFRARGTYLDSPLLFVLINETIL